MSRPLLKNTGTTGFATLLSRITGLVRDTLMAQALGVGPASDAFLVAFKIPNFLRRLFAEGAFSQSFVPVISEYKLQREPGRGARAGGRHRRHDGHVAVRAVGAGRDRGARHHPAVRAGLGRIAGARSLISRCRCCAGPSPTCSSSRSTVAVLRRAEQLRAVLHPRLHPGGHEPRDDRRGAVCRASAATIPGWCWRLPSSSQVSLQVLFQLPAVAQARTAGLAALAAGARGCAAHRAG